MTSRDWNTQNDRIIDEFRAQKGLVGGYFADKPLLLLTTTGARSGRTRTNPLGYTRDRGRYVVFGTVAGASKHPDWYYNLKVNPTIRVEVGTRTFPAVAEELDDTARAGLWPKLLAESPTVGEHQAKTTRRIPVFVAEPAR